MRHQQWFAFCLLLAITATARAADRPKEVPVQSAFAKFLDQIEVPAAEQGLLVKVSAREGHSVEAGELLATIDAKRAQLALARAKTELARAQIHAANDIKVRSAEKELRVAQLEFERAQRSNERYPNTVSPTELDRLQLAVERGELAIDQARHDLEDAALQVQIRENDLMAAEHEVERRLIRAPFSGLILEQRRQQGEWVEPGQTVLQLVRMDRLRVEGLVDARRVNESWRGRPVRVSLEVNGRSVTLDGVVTFVNPERDPVDNLVQLWAEVENKDLLLRPGMKCTAVVLGE